MPGIVQTHGPFMAATIVVAIGRDVLRANVTETCAQVPNWRQDRDDHPISKDVIEKRLKKSPLFVQRISCHILIGQAVLEVRKT